MDSYKHELNKSYEENCAIRRKYKELARSKRDEIVARFKQLAGIV